VLAKVVGEVRQGPTNRLENRRPPYSWEGDPLPRRAPGAVLASGFDVAAGNRSEPLLDGSTGEVVPVDEAEWGGWASWGM